MSQYPWTIEKKNYFTTIVIVVLIVAIIGVIFVAIVILVVDDLCVTILVINHF